MKKKLKPGLCILMALILLLGSVGDVLPAAAEENSGNTDGVSNATKVDISEENFPDETFRDIVKDWYDSDEDGTLSEEEIAKVTNMDVSGYSLESLKGIEYFSKLDYLDCRTSGLKSLDVSQNSELTGLFCGFNELTELDVSKNTKLITLSCDDNNLTSLDVSKNTVLEELSCDGNPLKELDVSNNTELDLLLCCRTGLTELDVSHNTKLTMLYCYTNELTELDVSQNTILEELLCYQNQLTELDVSANTALEWLNCSENKLTELNLGQNEKLVRLDCNDNQLTALDVSANKKLVMIDCSNNQLAALDVTKNDKLEKLYCYTNQLTELDVTQNKNLEELDCTDNKLELLDVRKNSRLHTLRCDDDVTVLQIKMVDLLAGEVLTIDDAAELTFTIEDESVAQAVEGGIKARRRGTTSIEAYDASGNLKHLYELTVYFRDVDPEKPSYFTNPVYWAANKGITTGKRGGRRFAPAETCTRAQIVTFLWRYAGEPEPTIENPFSDIQPTAYYYKAVLWAFENGITTGRSAAASHTADPADAPSAAKIFDPNGTCTRREIVTFLWRFAGKPEPHDTGAFTDVADENAYYYKAVYWAAERDITTGKKATNYTTFDPTGACSRGMAVTFLYRHDQW